MSPTLFACLDIETASRTTRLVLIWRRSVGLFFAGPMHCQATCLARAFTPVEPIISSPENFLTAAITKRHFFRFIENAYKFYLDVQVSKAPEARFDLDGVGVASRRTGRPSPSRLIRVGARPRDRHLANSLEALS
ncbi:unnamed protein product [Soboliphyme baturini]|uniref:Uncharacterized protein n=1 Tax=Soboliphyme baturini TaxID=241478 RepID=A0A183IMH9_9BILA|nr:unnamed protein product [Soboliphyme baturini]